jgi:hypothetical protein
VRTTRTRQLLVLLAGFFGLALLGAAPASADVNCSDLTSRSAAQAYFDGHRGDADHLDADGDGRACENHAPATPGDQSLVGLGVLVAALLVGNQLLARRKARPDSEREPIEKVGQRVSAPAGPRREGLLASTGHKQSLIELASTGSLDELTRALRLLRYGERMPLLEEYAKAHGSAPQDVLDALVQKSDDLKVQGWALAGYGPPAHVRLMFCTCVGGLRNFRLHTSPDGYRSWTCATCHHVRGHISDGDGGSTAHQA